MTSIFTTRCYVKRSIAVKRGHQNDSAAVVCQSVCLLSVTLLYSLYCGHVLGSYFESILITRMISLRSSHLGDPTSLI